jgi:hypothetical protein
MMKENEKKINGKAEKRPGAPREGPGAPREGPAGGAAVALVSAEEGEQALTQVRPLLDAMPASALGRITLHVPMAVSIGLGALPNIVARQDEFRRRLPEYDHERAGRLREFAHAALYAHIIAARYGDGSTRLPALLAEAAPLRTRMLGAAELHSIYGEFDAGRVATIRQGTGHFDTANDLIELAMLFRETRDRLAGKTPVTDGEIVRARELGLEIVDALGQRRVGTDGAATPTRPDEDRLKAFWLYAGTYEESRRAMTYVRWHEGDADLLVPSLFSGRRRRGSSSDEPGEAPPPVDPSESD